MTKFFSEAFQRSNCRCVYCGRDLLADFDSFMLAEEDHLVLISKNGKDEIDNIAIACAVCNRLKGNYVPDSQYDPSKRKSYIEACRAYIMNQRLKHMATYSEWVHEK